MSIVEWMSTHSKFTRFVIRGIFGRLTLSLSLSLMQFCLCVCFWYLQFYILNNSLTFFSLKIIVSVIMSFCYSNKNLELAILEDQRLILNAFHDFLFNFKKWLSRINLENVKTPPKIKSSFTNAIKINLISNFFLAEKW